MAMVKAKAAPVLLICSACAKVAPAVYLKSRLAGVMARSAPAAWAMPAYQRASKTFNSSRFECFARLIQPVHRQRGGKTSYPGVMLAERYIVMPRLGLFCLVVVTAAYGQRAAPHNAAVAPSTCDGIHADLRIGDL